MLKEIMSFVALIIAFTVHYVSIADRTDTPYHDPIDRKHAMLQEENSEEQKADKHSNKDWRHINHDFADEYLIPHQYNLNNNFVTRNVAGDEEKVIFHVLSDNGHEQFLLTRTQSGTALFSLGSGFTFDLWLEADRIWDLSNTGGGEPGWLGSFSLTNVNQRRFSPTGYIGIGYLVCGERVYYVGFEEERQFLAYMNTITGEEQILHEIELLQDEHYDVISKRMLAPIFCTGNYLFCWQDKSVVRLDLKTHKRKEVFRPSARTIGYAYCAEERNIYELVHDKNNDYTLSEYDLQKGKTRVIGNIAFPQRIAASERILIRKLERGFVFFFAPKNASSIRAYQTYFFYQTYFYSEERKELILITDETCYHSDAYEIDGVIWLLRESIDDNFILYTYNPIQNTLSEKIRSKAFLTNLYPTGFGPMLICEDIELDTTTIMFWNNNRFVELDLSSARPFDRNEYRKLKGLDELP